MKEKLNDIRNRIIDCVKEEYGIDLEIGTITYGDNSFSFSVKGFTGEDGKREEFLRFARKKGVNSSWFGMKFTDGKDTFKIIGIKSRGRKNVLLIENQATHKKYVCSKQYVEENL